MTSPQETQRGSRPGYPENLRKLNDEIRRVIDNYAENYDNYLSDDGESIENSPSHKDQTPISPSASNSCPTYQNSSYDGCSPFANPNTPVNPFDPTHLSPHGSFGITPPRMPQNLNFMNQNPSFGSAPPMMPQNQNFMNQNPMFQLLANQQNMMQCMANAFLMPKPDMMKFDGNPLNYWRFIRNFDETIHNKASTENEKLNFLLQFCEENVKQILRNCVLMNPLQGYYEARRILHERFGDPYVIACASVADVTEGPPIRHNDRKGLQSFADKLNDCQLTLTSIGYLDEVNSADNLRKIAERFPQHLKGKWLERVRSIREMGYRPRINDMANFVSQAAKSANDPVFGQIMEHQTKPQAGKEKRPFIAKPYKSNNFSVQIKDKEPQQESSGRERQTECVMCKDTSHDLTKCPKFEAQSYEEKMKFVRQKKLCFNCYKANHCANKCFKRSSCEVENCNRKHRTDLHPPAPTASDEKQDEVNSHTAVTKGNMKVCLPIVPVRVCGKDGETVVTYALLDKGSDATLCENDLAKALGLQGEEYEYKLNTIEKKDSDKKGQIVSMTIKPLDQDESVELPAVITMEEIPVSQSCMAKQEDINKWPHLKGINLPDVCGRVSLLIGNDVPEVFWVEEERRGKYKEPYAVKSILGWTILGPTCTNNGKKEKMNVNLVNAGGESDPLLDQLKKFWNVNEETSNKSGLGMSIEDKEALKKMESSVKQVNGHYQLSLPWKYENPYLPNDKYLAEARLKMLKRRLHKDEDLYEKYTRSINEYVDKGYARRVPDSELQNKERVWYLPHHPVINPNKPGKVRVVFDCAAKYKDTSLNDQLLQGPDLTNTLFGVLTRFRQEPVAIMADIEGMFNQVRVDPEDVDALKFLWWPNDDMSKDPIEMQMLVHLFGATSSPSCASFCLRKTAADQASDFQPETSETVNKNFYVDDLLKSVPTPEEAITLKDELKEMLQRGGFNLTKWSSNNKEVRLTITDDEKAKSLKNLSLDEDLPNERALGVLWDVNEDKFRIKAEVQDKPLTRRGILSVTSSVYDPLGMVGPFILPAKKLIQDLCRENYKWDEPIPEIHAQRWEQWLNDLPVMSTVSIDRCVKPQGFTDINRVELHTFADASEIGYGAVSYIRLLNSSGNYHVAFMGGRSRLAPLKNVTIPRLELSAAVLAVELAHKILDELELTIDELIYWTDSTSVLQYINNQSRRFKVYVANRISAIHERSEPNQWKYVRSADNPADDASRGLKGHEMTTDDRWFKGPPFLWRDRAEWPVQPDCVPELSQDHEELKKEFHVQQATINESCQLKEFIERYSKWYHLKKATAWLLRYKSYIMSKHGRKDVTVKSGSLTVEEIEEGGREVIKYVQRQHFEKEINRVNRKEPVQKTSKLVKLNPTIKDGLLVVGGRLENASISDKLKHPVIIPDSHISSLLVEYYHKESGHGGKEHVLSLLRQNYWVIKARSAVRRYLNRCLICKRRSASPMQQMMADLPADRITPEKPPFAHVGIDCFGPFMVKRGRSQEKRYGCIFTCLVTRAVHIEVLHSLETDSFIDALQRFISRRGRPEIIRSDNGTNFKGGQRELREELEKWNQEKIKNFLQQKQIKWLCNPPTASNFGGVWERLIRSVRSTLSVIMKQQPVYDETLSTLMTQVEGILNSRPLTKTSDDPADDEPLTPNHLLLLRGNKPMPPGSFTKNDALVRRWKQSQYLADLFWKRWLKEYLPLLQERQTWIRPKKNVSVGDLVLTKEEKNPRGQWPLARVIEVYKGKDGLVRSVQIKTEDGVLVRPVNKLCLLESACVIEEKSNQASKVSQASKVDQASKTASKKD